jgi:LDH2 family malate/lactate/ureidoglycolate dehydrogenase
MPVFSAEQLHKLGMGIFMNLGLREEDAKCVMDDLIQNDLMGDDIHGVVHIRNYAEAIKAGKFNIEARPKIVYETETTAIIDGNGQLGQVVADLGMRTAIKKAKKYNISAVGLRHCNYINRVGALAQMALNEGMIGLIFTNAGPPGGQVAPYGGKKAMIGTNPISCGIPTESTMPFLMDFATSIVAWNKVNQARKKGEKIPLGWIIDKEGNPTNDPEDFFGGGAILPMGAHKGYALGLMGEIVGGILTGSDSTIGEDWVEGNGVFIIVLNIESFMPKEKFQKETDRFLTKIKGTPTLEGVERILIPGELEYEPIEGRKREGIPVDTETWQNLTQLAKEQNVNLNEIIDY